MKFVEITFFLYMIVELFLLCSASNILNTKFLYVYDRVTGSFINHWIISHDDLCICRNYNFTRLVAISQVTLICEMRWISFSSSRAYIYMKYVELCFIRNTFIVKMCIISMLCEIALNNFKRRFVYLSEL